MTEIDDILESLVGGEYKAKDPNDQEAVEVAKMVGWFVEDKKEQSKQRLKSLFLDLTNEEYQAAFNRGEDDPVYVALVAVRKKVEEL